MAFTLSTESAEALSISAAVAELNSAADFLRGPFFLAQFKQELRRAALEAASPWLDREAAAAYARCSTSEIDRAAREGVFARHERGGTPMFLKSEIDAAITGGKWKRNLTAENAKSAKE